MARLSMARSVCGLLLFVIGQVAAGDLPAADELRPIWHFTPPSGWMNDPNGLIYAEGRWNLFYQYHPASTVWGPMHWGHATSTDLLHWEHQPIALKPDGDRYVFSGSIVNDASNRSGWGKSGKGPLVALYTIHDMDREKAGVVEDESEGAAYSLDGGVSFTPEAGNPVLLNPGGKPDFRDPSVFWHAPTSRWVMVLAAGDHIELYGSKDLRQWAFLSRFGEGVGSHAGVWECPDLFALPAGPGGAVRWVLLQSVIEGGPQGGSSTQYFVGDFDGTRFSVDPAFASRIAKEGAAWLDEGADHYAGVTWRDAPAGRRVLVGWMSNWRYALKVPATTWRSAMTAPRELSLRARDGRWYLVSTPAAEIARQRHATKPLGASSAAEILLPSGVARSGDIELDIDLPQAESHFAIELANADGESFRIGLDADGRWFADRRKAGDDAWAPGFAALHIARRKFEGPSVHIRLLLDRTSAELFADEGLTTMTDSYFPRAGFTRATLHLEKGARLRDGSASMITM
ncbi:MAG: hypothetical protein RLZZ200_1556 [Pseudomonadota bacterium]|jgi:fructan beta-fructosidase